MFNDVLKVRNRGGLLWETFKNKLRKRGMYFINIELTNACNLRCTYCSLTNSLRPKGYMTLKTFKRVLEICRENRQFVLDLSHFGEPLMHPELEKFVSYAREKDFFPGFCSNGLLLTPERFKKCIKAGIGWIAITFHGEKRQMGLVNKALTDQFNELRNNYKLFFEIAVENRIFIKFREFNDHRQFVVPERLSIIKKHDFAGMAPDRLDNVKFKGCDFLNGKDLVVFNDGKLGCCCYDERGLMNVGDIWNLSKIVKKKRYSMCNHCEGFTIPDIYGESSRAIVKASQDPKVDFEKFMKDHSL